MHRILLAALLLAAMPTLAQQAYVSGIEDLPMMPGLAEPAGSATVLDEPEGRIVDATAGGMVTPDAVAKYYASALPALGWRQIDASSYAREGETLTMETTAQTPGAMVKFSLRPNAR